VEETLNSDVCVDCSDGGRGFAGSSDGAGCGVESELFRCRTVFAGSSVGRGGGMLRGLLWCRDVGCGGKYGVLVSFRCGNVGGDENAGLLNVGD
jgi:hypothetical protein